LERINFIEINYHCHEELTDPADVIKKHLPSNLFAIPFLKYAQVGLVKHMDFKGDV
jgi:hypothetical protein